MAPSTAAKGAGRASGPKEAGRASGPKGAGQASGPKEAGRAPEAKAKGAVRAPGGAAANAVAASPAGAVALKAVGFTTVGPAAGSYAAAWMSSTAIANGGGVAAGSLYPAVQATAMGGGLLLEARAVLTVGADAGAGAAVRKALS